MNKKPLSAVGAEIESTSMQTLILRYSMPAIIGGLISAIYNIVDQIFIGWDMGVIGNSATNVAFPLVTLTNSLSMLFAVGAAANFSISLGKQDVEGAKKYIGVAISGVLTSGIIIMLITQLFTTEMLNFFGATEQNIDYATTYVKIVSLGYPLAMVIMGGAHIIRADGSPKIAMRCTMTGAIINCILDPIFIFGFNMGIAGAAWATILGQAVSFIMIVAYMKNFKTFPITRDLFNFDFKTVIKTTALGIAPAVNQFSMTITQIVMNNTLIHYGAQSEYGQDIPLAVVGIITKVNIIYITIVVGIAQGTQPIVGYNYGAKKYDRVIEAYKRNFTYSLIISVLAFLAFQLFPRQIISLFGTGSEEYFLFAERYFRIYLFMTIINCAQPITGNFFTAIGKAFVGMFVALTKQILMLVPLVIILPIFMGMDGVLYAGPIADFAAFSVAMGFVYVEYKRLKAMDAEQKAIIAEGIQPNSNNKTP